MKELGDVYEVIEAIMGYYEIDKVEVMKLKDERKIKRGGFKKRIFLESVDK
jgi:predicted house-cleaning noncanonical NTP pyrophosphatase (MazG superfamily)